MKKNRRRVWGQGPLATRKSAKPAKAKSRFVTGNIFTGETVVTEVDFPLDDRSFVYADPLLGEDKDAAGMVAVLELCNQYRQAALARNEIEQRERIDEIVNKYTSPSVSPESVREQAEFMIARHRMIYPEQHASSSTLLCN
jgi:hypothetical protein